MVAMDRYNTDQWNSTQDLLMLYKVSHVSTNLPETIDSTIKLLVLDIFVQVMLKLLTEKMKLTTACGEDDTDALLRTDTDAVSTVKPSDLGKKYKNCMK